jgi:hypothetical protein
VSHNRLTLADRVQPQHERMGGAYSLSRYAPIRSRCRTSGWVTRCSSSWRLAASSHCKSSRKRTSGCSLSGEDAKEGPEHRLEPVLRSLREEFCHGRLLADDKLGDEVYDELTVQTYGIPDRVAPALDLRLVLAQNLANQGLEGLGDRDERRGNSDQANLC